MSRNESQKYKALPKGYSRLCVLSGQTENEEGSVEMVIGSDVDTMKMKTSSVKMSTQYEESPTNFRHKLQKNFQGMSKKITRPILEGTLLMVVVSFYLLETKVPSIFLKVLLVNVTKTSIVFYLQLLLSCLHLIGSTFQGRILNKMFMLDMLSLSMVMVVMVLEKGRRTQIRGLGQSSPMSKGRRCWIFL